MAGDSGEAGAGGRSGAGGAVLAGAGGMVEAGGAGGWGGIPAGGGAAGRAGSSGGGGVTGEPCLPGLLACEGECVDPTDPAHCGACESVCLPGWACTGQRCACPGEAVACGSECVDLGTDGAHCGECAHACSAEQECLEGQCRSGPCDGICTSAGAFTLADDGYRLENLGTGSHCVEVAEYAPVETAPRLVCWNFDVGRTLAVNGQEVACETGYGVPLATTRVGGYCVQVGEGQRDVAGLLLPFQ